MDRRSIEGMRAILSRARRAQPENLFGYMRKDQIKEVCELVGVSPKGKRDELIGRLVNGKPEPKQAVMTATRKGTSAATNGAVNKSNDIDAMIDELVEYKKAHYPDDRRRILTCGSTPRKTIRVEWLPPVAPGVDAKWETQLYGLVRTGDGEKAICFLRETRGMPRSEAMQQVAKMAADLGMR